MFEKVADFWDIVIFGFVLLILASLQLRYATFAEGVLALAALVFGVGLIMAQKWAVLGTYITLLLAIAVYFAQIWYLPIVTGEGRYVGANILKMAVAILLFLYIGRERIEQRFS